MSSLHLEAARSAVESCFPRRHGLSPAETAALLPHLERGLAALDSGVIRAAQQTEGRWVANEWVKKLIMLCLMFGKEQPWGQPGQPSGYDKLRLKFDAWSAADFAGSRIRAVPGAVVRRGAYIAPGVVLMPSFVNIGAYVGESTMVDTWATIGSCAQVGAHCHISGGAGIGGVLEPLGDTPVVIEDHVFVGARCEVAEGVRVRRGAVLAMGVFLGRSTPIVHRRSGEVSYGEVPENAVVVPGARASDGDPTLSTYAAVIVKYADAATRGKTALNPDVRARQ